MSGQNNYQWLGDFYPAEMRSGYTLLHFFNSAELGDLVSITFFIARVIFTTLPYPDLLSLILTNIFSVLYYFNKKEKTCKLYAFPEKSPVLTINRIHLYLWR